MVTKFLYTLHAYITLVTSNMTFHECNVDQLQNEKNITPKEMSSKNVIKKCHQKMTRSTSRERVSFKCL